MNWTVRLKKILIFLAIVPALEQAAFAQEVPVVNNLDIPIKVFFYSRDKKSWVSPAMVLQPKQKSTFSPEGNGQYYLVARTETPDQFEKVLGWTNLKMLSDRNANAILAIDGKLEKQQRQKEYTVRVPVTELKTIEKTINQQVCRGGVWQIVPVVVTETVPMTSYKMETRTRTEDFYAGSISAAAQAGSAALMSDVEFKTVIEGAFVFYQLVGRDEVWRADNPTNSTQSIPVGTYFVWTERDNVASEKQHYDIFEETRVITLPER